MNFTRIGAACVLSVALGASAQAQQVQRILSGYPPGGAIDVIARLFADELGKETGKPFVVETKSGAGGLLALKALMASPADGSTLLVTPDTNIVIYPHTVKNPGYNALKDLTPVGLAGNYDLAFVVKADPKVPDLKAFVAQAKVDPKMATFGSPGPGSLPHFYGLTVGQATGANLTHVPYRGSGPAITDTMGGMVGAVATPIGTVLQQVKAGNLKILATSGTQRGTNSQDVPTFKELGYPQLAVTGWFGIFAPAGTPPEVITRLNEQINRALRKPEMKARLAALDVDPREVSPAQLAAEIKADDAKWAKVLQASGFTADSP